MVTRRTTMKGHKGMKPSPARARSGRTEGAHGIKDRRPLEAHHMSAAEVGARLDEVENRLMRAARGLAKVGRSSMEEAHIAAEAVRHSLNEAVGAVRHAVRKIAKQVTTAAQSI